MPLDDETQPPGRAATQTETATDTERRPSSSTLPERVGRYTVLQRLGEGGLGVVLEAFDPELDRLVALKLVPTAQRSSSATARLVREARAIARVSHPNVIAVYDAGSHEDSVYVAMEYVAGRTLRDWLDEDDPGLEDVLRVFDAAGRGLAAAHAVGIVHRDFKPHNVMIGDDGRVRVLDFGLARALDDDSREPGGAGTSATAAPNVTRTGAVVGTPAYMAPEQYERNIITARTDQFSFAVSLFEGLCGRRPFSGASYEELRAQICAPLTPRFERSMRIPAAVETVVRKALSRDEAGRYDSMESMLGALAKARSRRGRLVVLALALALAAVVGFMASRGNSAMARCEAGAAAANDLWSAQRATRVAASFAATGRPNADDMANRIGRAAERRLDRWRDARTDACAASYERGNQSDSMLDLRLQCLEDRRRESEALLEALEAVDTEAAVDTALQELQSLPPIEDCGDPAILGRVVPLPSAPAERRAVLDAERSLAEARAAFAVRRYDRALELLEPLDEAARELDRAPLRAALSLLRAEIYRDSFATDVRVREALEQAIRDAGNAGDAALVARALSLLVALLGREQERFAEARALFLPAEAAVALAGGDPHAEAFLAQNIGSALHGMGDLAAARPYLERAVTLRRSDADESPLRLADALAELAPVLLMLGDDDAGLETQRQALATYRAELGDEHVKVAAASQNLALALSENFYLTEAVPLFRESLALKRRLLGDSHYSTGFTLNNLAFAHMLLGWEGDALRGYVESLAVKTASLGPDNTQTITTLRALAELQLTRGETAAAEQRVRDALARLERADAADSFYAAKNWLTLAAVLAQSGDVGASATAIERGLDIARATLGERSEFAADGLRSVSRAYSRAGDHARSAATMERANALDPRPAEATDLDAVRPFLESAREHAHAGDCELADARFAAAFWKVRVPAATWVEDSAVAPAELERAACWSAAGRTDRARQLLETSLRLAAAPIGNQARYRHASLTVALADALPPGDARRSELLDDAARRAPRDDPRTRALLERIRRAR